VTTPLAFLAGLIVGMTIIGALALYLRERSQRLDATWAASTLVGSNADGDIIFRMHKHENEKGRVLAWWAMPPEDAARRAALLWKIAKECAAQKANAGWPTDRVGREKTFAPPAPLPEAPEGIEP
jgi:hypothetical protein